MNRTLASDEPVEKIERGLNNQSNTPWAARTNIELSNDLLAPFRFYLGTKKLLHEKQLLDAVTEWVRNTYPWPKVTDIILHIQGPPDSRKADALISIFNIVFGGTYEWAVEGDDLVPVNGRTMCLELETLSEYAREKSIQKPCVIVSTEDLPEHWAVKSFKIPLFVENKEGV